MYAMAYEEWSNDLAKLSIVMAMCGVGEHMTFIIVCVRCGKVHDNNGCVWCGRAHDIDNCVRCGSAHGGNGYVRCGSAHGLC